MNLIPAIPVSRNFLFYFFFASLFRDIAFEQSAYFFAVKRFYGIKCSSVCSQVKWNSTYTFTHTHKHADFSSFARFTFFFFFYFFFFFHIFVPNSPKFNAIQATCIFESKWPDFSNAKICLENYLGKIRKPTSHRPCLSAELDSLIFYNPRRIIVVLWYTVVWLCLRRLHGRYTHISIFFSILWEFFDRYFYFIRLSTTSHNKYRYVSLSDIFSLNTGSFVRQLSVARTRAIIFTHFSISIFDYVFVYASPSSLSQLYSTLAFPFHFPFLVFLYW